MTRLKAPKFNEIAWVSRLFKEEVIVECGAN